MIRKKDFEKYELDYRKEFVCAQDYDLWARAAKYLVLGNLQEVLLKYRVNGNNITILKKQQKQEEELIIKQDILSFLSCDTRAQKQLMRTCLRLKRITFW